MDKLAPLSTKTLIGFEYLSALDNFLFNLLYFLLKIVAKVIGTGGFSSSVFLLFIGLPTGRGTRGVVVKTKFSNFSEDFKLNDKFLLIKLNLSTLVLYLLARLGPQVLEFSPALDVELSLLELLELLELF